MPAADGHGAAGVVEPDPPAADLLDLSECGDWCADLVVRVVLSNRETEIRLGGRGGLVNAPYG